MSVNPLAYYDMAAGVGQNIVAGQQRGQQNALMMHELELDAAQRSALGNYLAAPEGERAAAFNDLVAQSPERAANVLAIENAQAEQAQGERQRIAREAIPLLQHILRSESPEIAGDLLANSLEENNPLRGLLQSLHQQGAINLDDGVSADEWRQIADLGIAHLTPIAFPDSAPGQQRVQSTQVLEDGTIAYVTSDGRIVRTSERARNPMQVADVGGGRAVVDRLTGDVQMLSTAETERQAAAQRAEAEKLAGTRGQSTAQRWATQIDEGFAAADSLPVLRRGLELMKNVGVETGGLEALKLWASNRLGVTGADEGELSANLGKAVLAQLRSTFGAQFTEREGARLSEIEAGFGKSTAANTRLLEQAYQLVERTARRGINAARDAGDDEAARMIDEAMNFRITYDDVPAAPTAEDDPLSMLTPEQRAVYGL